MQSIVLQQSCSIKCLHLCTITFPTCKDSAAHCRDYEAGGRLGPASCPPPLCPLSGGRGQACRPDIRLHLTCSSAPTRGAGLKIGQAHYHSNHDCDHNDYDDGDYCCQQCFMVIVNVKVAEKIALQKSTNLQPPFFARLAKGGMAKG